ncbi:3-methyl-2-oxobutanoate hydroxymethyltransferase [Flammeovirga kamogawensis]|uniref:3-methyl-2-oxobutanoate hydroxymethyltransferase n=1 Tax=Flammeovirga kamogawensis TaxID=373891 RepID=A0ABX8H0F4_9BACT|nr:3-methyl-2-oxobutanoate hydroxymethyltransferase [Flammeovirga kamogawensis]MBB6462229.1 3-methyl-2-oxobutanoate hydroxymethyltransferase [Flammeovirga kamogawensis]QWG09370.1 3-methyl-2-oxobutanoate hydroxymethyltransferase [Flammeovirga kamogawensis]TRX64890.1 3-methyl-2-oxobutanoate hydroxymethyltransferase [Flammeovirga kamogawensis]
MSIQTPRTKKVTALELQKMKKRGEKITFLTSYDYTMAKIVDNAGIDAILVGDTASNVMAGNDTTLPITLDNMIYHAKSVVNAVENAMVVSDIPFGSYQGDPLQALHAAVRIMKESGANAVKVEGGEEIKESIQKILTAGIPVVGHLGLTPQSIFKFGTFSVQAKKEEEAKLLLKNAKLLEELGCFAVVLEAIPADLAKEVSEALTIPTIGIGAGPDTDGQVLVIHDMLGMTPNFKPKYLRKYAEVGQIMDNAIKNYISDVKEKAFPSYDESY